MHSNSNHFMVGMPLVSHRLASTTFLMFNRLKLCVFNPAVNVMLLWPSKRALYTGKKDDSSIWVTFIQTGPSSQASSEIAQLTQLETKLSHQTSAQSSARSLKIQSSAQFNRTEPGLEFYRVNWAYRWLSARSFSLLGIM